MCLLFETVRIVNGMAENPDLHEQRMNHSRRELLGRHDRLRLSDHLHVPEEFRKGVVRCRVIYGPEVVSTEFLPYLPLLVKTLRLVVDDCIEYSHKYLDRNNLTQKIDKRLADDILIVKNGFITDASFANVAFTAGKGWVTPDTPLLQGTMRKKLLSEGVITAESIPVGRLREFSRFRLINAMLGFSFPETPVSNILYLYPSDVQFK